MQPTTAPQDSPSRFRLGNWTVRTDDGSLVRGGREERVEPKVMSVLAYLASRPGEVATKEEILASVWPDAVVEEGALARCVSELRRVLGDDARQPRYIETLPRRGYRLVAAVEPFPSSAPPSIRSSPMGTRLLLGAILLAAGASLFWATREERPRHALSGQPTRVAVLPFTNLGMPEDSYFAAGVTEELTSRLASLKGLAVTSRTSADQYAEGSKSVPEIGEELGVDYVIEGSVRWQPSEDGPGVVRITPQLIRVADDLHVWTDVYDRDFVEIFALQTELAREVTRQLGVTLDALERRRLDARPTASVEAYQAFLRAGAAAADRTGDPDHIKLVVDLYERATELDPEFALAHAELSLYHSGLFHDGIDRTDARREAARLDAERALSLDAKLPEAHLAMGYYYYRGYRDYDRALAEYAAARSGMPNDSQLLAAVAFIKRRQGRFDDALRDLRRAAMLDPRNAYVQFAVAQTEVSLRHWESADEAYTAAIDLAPDLLTAHFERASTRLWASRDLAAAIKIHDGAPGGPFHGERGFLAYLGGDLDLALEEFSRQDVAMSLGPYFVVSRDLKLADVHAARGDAEAAQQSYQRAVRSLEAARSENPEDFRIPGELGLAYAGLGERDEAVEWGTLATELLPTAVDAFDGPAYLADLARVHAMLGEPDAALDLIERLLSMPAGRWMSKNRMRLDPRLAPLRGHPRYERLISGG